MRNKKTIVFIQNVEFPQQGAIDIFYYAKYLSKYDDTHVKIIVRKINENISHENLEIVQLWNISYIQFIRKAFLQIKNWHAGYKIAYTYFFAQHPWSVLLQFLVKYILKISTMYDVVSWPIGKSITSTIAKWTIKIWVLLADRYIVLHTWLIKKLGLPLQKKHDIIPMGYDEDIFYPYACDRFDKKTWDIIFTYIGTLDATRNLDILMGAFVQTIEQYPHIKLYIIWDGNNYNKLVSIAWKYKDSNVFFLWLQPHHLIPDYINSSDVLISYVPKIDHFEYQPPTKLIEYLACNKPVMVTNTVAQCEILKNHNFLIHRDDKESTYNQICWCIKNIRKLQWYTYKDIVKQYSRRILCKQLKDLI